MALAAACADPAPEDSVSFERAVPAAFRGHEGPGEHVPFDAVATDMDRDGDPDLLISWHHIGPLELFENEAGVFERVDSPERDASGLFDNPGVPDLFAEVDEIEPRIFASGLGGLYVWHDAGRLGSWRFLWHDPVGRYSEVVFDVEASRGFSETEGLAPRQVKRRKARTLSIRFSGGAPVQRFRAKARALTGRLVIVPRGAAGEVPPPIFVGRRLTRSDDGPIELWKPDPHGLAWVDVEASPQPELYVTRGGLAGFLKPPLVGKRDRYYVHQGGSQPLYRPAAAGVLSRDHRRGRQVEWVDVDADGTFELWITAKGGGNALLVRDPVTGTLRDAAERTGLAEADVEVGSWGDLDEDGLSDLFFLGSGAIDVALNRGASASFERIAGADLGLVVPDRKPDGPELFAPASLRQADFDADGRLDLWLLGHGPDRTNHLFLRRGDVFEEVSDSVGLTPIRGDTRVVLLDVDNDSFPDALSFGPEHARIWRNRGGERFEFARLGDGIVPEPIHAAVVGDFDGDGAIDVVAVGHERHLLRNRAAGAGSFVDVALRQPTGEPIGALVRAIFANGRASLQRYGSMRSSRFSQALQPLHFGIPPGVALEKIGVRWPGEATEELYDVGAPGRRIGLERGAGAPGG